MSLGSGKFPGPYGAKTTAETAVCQRPPHRSADVVAYDAVITSCASILSMRRPSYFRAWCALLSILHNPA